MRYLVVGEVTPERANKKAENAIKMRTTDIMILLGIFTKALH